MKYLCYWMLYYLPCCFLCRIYIVQQIYEKVRCLISEGIGTLNVNLESIAVFSSLLIFRTLYVI